MIPNWNGGELLSTCLEALARQTLAPTRVLVVDNGSTDGSQRVVRDAGAEWHGLDHNTGFAGAVNVGIRASDAPLVALLNNDAVADPGWLGALVRALDRDPSISFAASRMLFTDGRGVNAAGDGFDVRGRGGYNRGIFEPDGPRFDEPRIVFGACAGAAIYRRSLFDDIGVFAEDLFVSWEDIELDLRAALAGHRCLYVPDAVVHHVQGATPSPGRLALERRNKARLALRNLPLPLLVLYLGLLPVREAIETRIARQGPREYLARLRPYATELRASLAQRGRTPRRASLTELWPLLTRESLPYDPPSR